jgi:hypothetical protein
MNPYLVAAGVWIVLDGLGSIVLYRKQRWYEHAVRVLRAGVGLGVIAGGLIL